MAKRRQKKAPLRRRSKNDRRPPPNKKELSRKRVAPKFRGSDLAKKIARVCARHSRGTEVWRGTSGRPGEGALFAKSIKASTRGQGMDTDGMRGALREIAGRFAKPLKELSRVQVIVRLKGGMTVSLSHAIRGDVAVLDASRKLLKAKMAYDWNDSNRFRALELRAIGD